MADTFREIHEVRKGMWAFFLYSVFWMLIGWASKLRSHGIGCTKKSILWCENYNSDLAMYFVLSCQKQTLSCEMIDFETRRTNLGILVIQVSSLSTQITSIYPKFHSGQTARDEKHAGQALSTEVKLTQRYSKSLSSSPATWRAVFELGWTWLYIWTSWVAFSNLKS